MISDNTVCHDVFWQSWGLSSPGVLNTHRPAWTSMDSLHEPEHIFLLAFAVTHVDEMFFNTQSTVLTSQWKAGIPLRSIKYWFWGTKGPLYPGDIPSPAPIIWRLVELLRLLGQMEVTLSTAAGRWAWMSTYCWRKISFNNRIYSQTGSGNFSSVIGMSNLTWA